MKHIIIIGATVTFLLLLTTPTSLAMDENEASQKNEQETNQPIENKMPNKPKGKRPPPKHHDGKPPQEAIDICLNKNKNSSCSFQGPNYSALGALENGTCEFTPDKQYFACKPNKLPLK